MESSHIPPKVRALKEEAIEILAAPENEPYFLVFASAYLEAVKKTQLDADNPEKNSAFRLAWFFQILWEELPDSPSIRQPTFFKICSIAESFVEDFETLEGSPDTTEEDLALLKTFYSD